MGEIRLIWETVFRQGHYTVFQKYLWNLLALSAFSGREQPWIVCAEASYGTAIVPAVLRRGNRKLRLLGDELFDYRNVLHQGDDEVLRSALAELARLTVPLDVVAVRESDSHTTFEDLHLEHFSAAPMVCRADIDSDCFSSIHGRLGRNLRRMNRLGFALKMQNGDNGRLVRSIYQRKAEQDPESLFHDHLRIDFLVNVAAVDSSAFEIFTLGNGPQLGAALVTFRDRNIRRFYTTWFDPALEKHSPGMTLIHEITRQSLEAGLDCDYMTGEQPYKMRLATRTEALYRVRASSRQLAAFGHCYQRLSA